MTILEVPYIFTIHSRPDRRYKIRPRLTLGHISVDIPEVELAEPAINVLTHEGNTVDWHIVERRLRRPVSLFEKPATLAEIEAEVDLILPTDRLTPWFSDHPSALHRLHPSTFVPSPEGLIVEDSDEWSLKSWARTTYSNLVINNNNVLATANPPTWAVRILRGRSIVIDYDLGDRQAHPSIDLHFGPDKRHLAEEFSQWLVGRPAESIGEINADDWTPSISDGAASTVRAAATLICPPLLEVSMAELEPAMGWLVAALRYAYEAGLNDLEADDILVQLESSNGPWPEPVSQFINWLQFRRSLILYDFGAYALDAVGRPS